MPQSATEPHDASKLIYKSNNIYILIFIIIWCIKDNFCLLFSFFCCRRMAKRTGVIIWRDCNSVDVVIARVFSRIFSESSELEAEVARCRNDSNVKTCLWKWPEEHQRTRLVFFFETPVPSNIFFEGTHGAGLLRSVAPIAFPIDVFASRDLIVPRRCLTNVSYISLISIHRSEAKCESRGPCVLQFLISATEISSIRGVWYFRLMNSAQYEALVNAMNESSLILTFEVWQVDSSFVFRTWSSTSTRVSVLRNFLQPYSFLALSETDTSSVFGHLACRCFVCPKVTEIKDVTFESCFLEASVSPNQIAQWNEKQDQKACIEDTSEWSQNEEPPKTKDLFECSDEEEDGENGGESYGKGKSDEAKGDGDKRLSQEAECEEVEGWDEGEKFEGTTPKISALPWDGVAKGEVEVAVVVEGEGKRVGKVMGDEDMGDGLPPTSDGEDGEGRSGTMVKEGEEEEGEDDGDDGQSKNDEEAGEDMEDDEVDEESEEADEDHSKMKESEVGGEEEVRESIREIGDGGEGLGEGVGEGKGVGRIRRVTSMRSVSSARAKARVMARVMARVRARVRVRVRARLSWVRAGARARARAGAWWRWQGMWKMGWARAMANAWRLKVGLIKRKGKVISRRFT